ncbi:hypothetical protein Tco_0822170 [Tanacetum coccineum]|uniref:Uncharacterized protein n=1 Tax=Tanacetum coccineum TaxID=301880 RepID=A0ABQ5AFE1_9ASTR
MVVTTSTQDGKRSQDDDSRLCLVDDLKEAQGHIQVKLKETSSSLKSKDRYAYHKLKEKIQDHEQRPKTFIDASIIPLTRLDFTLSFLLNASTTTFDLSKRHTNHSSRSRKPLLVLRPTHTSDSSQLGKYFLILHCFTLSKLSIQLLLP